MATLEILKFIVQIILSSSFSKSSGRMEKCSRTVVLVGLTGTDRWIKASNITFTASNRDTFRDKRRND